MDSIAFGNSRRFRCFYGGPSISIESRVSDLAGFGSPLSDFDTSVRLASQVDINLHESFASEFTHSVRFLASLSLPMYTHQDLMFENEHHTLRTHEHTHCQHTLGKSISPNNHGLLARLERDRNLLVFDRHTLTIDSLCGCHRTHQQALLVQVDCVATRARWGSEGA